MKNATASQQLRFINASLNTITCDNHGEPIRIKYVDQVVEDIFGEKEVIRDLYCAKTQGEAYRALDRIGAENLLKIFDSMQVRNIFQNCIEAQMRVADLEERSKKLYKYLKKKSLSKKKRNTGCREYKEMNKELKYIAELYNDCIKRLRKVIGVKKGQKKKRYKEEFSAMREFVKKQDRRNRDDDDDDFGFGSYFDLEEAPVKQSPLTPFDIAMGIQSGREYEAKYGRRRNRDEDDIDVDIDEDDEDGVSLFDEFLEAEAPNKTLKRHIVKHPSDDELADLRHRINAAEKYFDDDEDEDDEDDEDDDDDVVIDLDDVDDDDSDDEDEDDEDEDMIIPRASGKIQRKKVYMQGQFDPRLDELQSKVDTLTCTVAKLIPGADPQKDATIKTVDQLVGTTNEIRAQLSDLSHVLANFNSLNAKMMSACDQINSVSLNAGVDNSLHDEYRQRLDTLYEMNNQLHRDMVAQSNHYGKMMQKLYSAVVCIMNDIEVDDEDVENDEEYNAKLAQARAIVDEDEEVPMIELGEDIPKMPDPMRMVPPMRPKPEDPVVNPGDDPTNYENLHAAGYPEYNEKGIRTTPTKEELARRKRVVIPDKNGDIEVEIPAEGEPDPLDRYPRVGNDPCLRGIEGQSDQIIAEILRDSHIPEESITLPPRKVVDSEDQTKKSK